MTEASESLIRAVTSNPVVASLLLVAIVVIAVASLTDALTKIHAFYHKAVGEKPAREPEPEWRAQFESLRRNILFCGLSNNLPVHLSELYHFFLESGLIERQEVKAFHDRWLTNIAVAMGVPVVNAFSAAAIADMKEELRAMQL